jgi:hypothetical protein
MSRVATSLNSEKGSAVVWVQPVDVSGLLYIPRSGQPKIRSQKYGMVSFTIEHDPGATSIRLKGQRRLAMAQAWNRMLTRDRYCAVVVRHASGRMFGLTA